MGSPIFLLDKFKTLWTVWDLRGAVLLSLFFQVLLLFIASSRKRTGRIKVTFFLWSAYLLADWVATFAIGLIASGPSEYGKKTLNDDLNAFWASFLLGHLGGPHTISAFALEDNELWIRHMLQLIIHLLGIAYVFYQSLPNQLWVPISLVYLAGLIKYGERTRALYLASLGTMKTSTLPPAMAGSNYARLMQAYRSKVDASVPVDIIEQDAPEVEPPAYMVNEGAKSTEITMVRDGWRFFDMFKGLVVDITYGYRDWQKTREFFFKKTVKETYKIMEIELNFLYDLLYTKMLVVQYKMGLLFRFVCLACVVAALERFKSYQHHLKLDIDDHDINITYTLLIGAISLDVVAFIMLTFSDWTIVSLPDRPIEVLKCCNYTKLLNFSYEKLLATLRRKRWSQCVSQYSLMNYCLPLNLRFKVMNKVFYRLGAKDSFDESKYKEIVPILDDLKEFIFKELREKAVKAKNSKEAKEICSWRGERELLKASRFYTSLADSVQVEYDESVLRWHVATELLYYTTTDDKSEQRQYCKIMSQYMLYLMIMRPTMMSTVTGIVQIRFQDTCAETKKFFLNERDKNLTTKILNWFTEKLKDPCGKAKMGDSEQSMKIYDGFTKKLKDAYEKAKNFLGPGREETSKAKKEEEDLQNACNKLLEVDTIVAPDKVKAGTSKSVLFDACIMAKDLRNMEAKDRWEIMSSVWVELLSYAASHCRAYAHAQQLSKGGEFITFVWLLMIHFGLGEQFRVDPESRYILAVAK